MMAKIEPEELARLRAVEEKYRTLTVDHGELQRQTSQVFRLIAGTPQFFEKLTTVAGPVTDDKSTAGTPTNDGNGWQIDFGAMTLVIVPTADELKLRDKASTVPDGIFKLAKDGTIDAQTQTLMLGHAERIVRAAAPEGFDPVSEATSLIGQASTTS